MNEILYALTLKQPWLWAVLHAGKTIENRKWPPPAKIIRKIIALHASKGFDYSGTDFLWHRGLSFPAPLPRGCILGIATVEGYLTQSADPWFFGPYGWVLSNVRVLPEPIPARGMLGLWQVNPLMAERVVALLALSEVKA